jgi:hypothetical protein
LIDRDHNFCVLAWILRIGENDFSTFCNFKELRVAKRSHIQLPRYAADFDLFGRLTKRVRGGHYTSSNMAGASPTALALQFEIIDAASAAEHSVPVQRIEIIVHVAQL